VVRSFGMSVMVVWAAGCTAEGTLVGSTSDSTDGSLSGDEDPVGSGTTGSGFPSVDDFAADGPYEVVELDAGPDCTVFHPSELGADGLAHPVVLWGNGTYTSPAVYRGVLTHWASHGFLVAAANTAWAGTGEEMLACLDLLTTENDRQDSAYAGLIDLDRVGASGHSQGGGGSIMAGRDARVTTTAPLQPYTEQGFGGYEQSAQSEQQGPMFMMSGAEDDIAPIVPNQQRVWDTINEELVWGTLDGADHIFAATGDISGFRGPATAWLRTHLMGDALAASVFYDPCDLCEDPEWDVQRKNN